MCEPFPHSPGVFLRVARQHKGSGGNGSVLFAILMLCRLCAIVVAEQEVVGWTEMDLRVGGCCGRVVECKHWSGMVGWVTGSP